MVELRRFFTDHEAGSQKLPFSDLAFGRLLSHSGVSVSFFAVINFRINLSTGLIH